MVKEKPNAKKVVQLMFSQTKAFILFCVTTLLIVFFSVCTLILLKGFIDKVIILKDYSRISYYVVPLIATFILGFATLIFHSVNKTSIIASVSKELSQNVYDGILNSEMSNFENNDYSRSVKKAIKNCEFIANEYIGKNVLTFIEDITLIIGVLITALIVQPLFGLIILIILPLFGVITKTLGLFVHRIDNEWKNSLEDNNKKIIETFENIKNIKLLNGLEYQKEEFKELNKKYTKSLTNKNSFKSLNSIAIIALFVGMIYAIIVGIGGVIDQNTIIISAGTYLMFTLLVPIVVFLMYKIVHLKLASSFIEVQLRDIEKLIDLKSEIKSEPVNNFDELHTIKFKDVIVTENKVDVVNKISFELKKGEKLGIYCTDSHLKSLIFDLITRLRKPDEGNISINNCDYSKIAPEYLRSLISTIYVDSNVFSDSVKNNICYPEEFDEYKFNDALYRSGLKFEIEELPKKELTKISSFDKNEFNRRVVYANAFYKDAKVYLINDSSDGTEVPLETEMINEVYKLKNKIVIIETDKPHLLNKCDKILIIEDGMVSEFGRKEELLKIKTSRFSKLIKSVGLKKSKIS